MVDNTLSTPLHDLPTVQLRHTLPDRTSHVDWMIAQDPLGVRPLWTFRTERRIDKLRNGESVDLLILSDHRPQYLRYEGPVSRNRGEVQQLISGRVRSLHREQSRWRLEIAWLSGDDHATHQHLQVDFTAPGRAVVAASQISADRESESILSSGGHSTRKG